MLAPGLRARAAADAEALLLTCMDYRLFHDIAAYMAGLGLNGKYDHIVLAGASLGAQTGKFPAWSTTFWQHLDTAEALHGIERVMLLDHRDCGAYKIILGEAAVATPEAETTEHERYLRSLAGLVRDRYPALKVEGD